MREARGFQGPNKVPAEVYLPPAQPEACRSGIGVVVAVPIFSPGGHLQRAQPPDILAGISISAVAQMCEAVDEALHMQRIDKANCAYPEEALPSQGSSAEQREQYDGHFSISPHFVDTLVEAIDTASASAPTRTRHAWDWKYPRAYQTWSGGADGRRPNWPERLSR